MFHPRSFSRTIPIRRPCEGRGLAFFGRSGIRAKVAKSLDSCLRRNDEGGIDSSYLSQCFDLFSFVALEKVEARRSADPQPCTPMAARYTGIFNVTACVGAVPTRLSAITYAHRGGSAPTVELWRLRAVRLKVTPRVMKKLQ